jgi:hypothetical protein
VSVPRLPRSALVLAALAVSGSSLCVIASGAGTNSIRANGGAGPGGGPSGENKNLCLNREIRQQRGLLCPDLRMSAPFDIEVDQEGGTPILRAANSINSVGDGPAELHGERSGRFTMDAVNRVYKKNGGRVIFKTGAELVFKNIPGQGPYWKWRDAAKVELWSLGPDGNRIKRVAVGEKQVYCLRDLVHTNPDLPDSPGRAVYPGCSQNPNQKERTLGTSVGWSDVYPSSYYEQYVKLNHLPRRGCYAYVHIADPQNGIYEMDEENNEASTTVYLTKRGKYLPGRCEGVHDQGLPKAQTADDTQVPGDAGGRYAG